MFEFSANSPLIYALVAVILSVVVAQSVFFLVKSYKRGLELGIDKKTLNSTIKRSALFTIAPAIAIFMGVVSLVRMLGVAFVCICSLFGFKYGGNNDTGQHDSNAYICKIPLQ